MYPQSYYASAPAAATSSSSSLSSSSSRHHQYQHYPSHPHTRPRLHRDQSDSSPYHLRQHASPPHPPRSSSSSSSTNRRAPTPTLNQHSSPSLAQEQRSRYPVLRQQQSPQFWDIGSSPEQPPSHTLPKTKNPSRPPPSFRLPPSDKPTLLDRRRESLLKNASLRVHPFIAMGNSQTKLADSDNSQGDGVPVCTSPVRRWEGSNYNKDTVTSNSSVTAAPTPTPTSATHTRSASVAPASTVSLVPSDRPASSHQRAASESGSFTAPPAKADPPPRRALGLVRKISFRSRAERATPTARLPPPSRAASADDAELLATPKDFEPVTAPPPKLTVSTSHSSSLTRASSVGHGPQPARPMRSTRRSAQAAFGTEESPAATPSKTTAREQGPSTPTRSVNRTLVPRSPTVGPVSPRRASPGSPHRQSMTTARRAEREWKAKLAALTAPPPSPGRLRLSNGPRPPPRRVQRPSAPPSLGGTDTLSGRMAQSLSLSNLPSLDGTDTRISSASCPPANLESIREFPTFDHPGSAFTAPSTVFTGVSGVSKSASTSTISRPTKRSPGSSVVAIPGVPEYERTPLSPIEQEPLSPHPMTPVARAGRAHAHHSPAPSIAKSLAPSQKTFGPGPSPSAMSRPLDWTPDERVVVSRSSVPDLARVSSPPPVPSLPPGMRLAEKTPPAPAPSCTPSPPRSFSHLPAPPTLNQPIIPPRRSESRRIHETKPVAPVVIDATPSHRLARLRRRGTDSPEPLLPRTTSLQHAREISDSPRTITVEVEEVTSDVASHKLRSTYDLTPGLDTGRRPRKTGLPMDDLERWLAQTAVA